MMTDKLWPYEDIVNRSRPVVEDHPVMSMHDRAAQFSPFAALKGYEDAVLETGRVTDAFAEMDEQHLSELNMTLNWIAQHLPEHPDVELTVFTPDARKDGGQYETVRGSVREIREESRQLILTDKTVIALDRIAEINILQKPEAE